MVVLDGREGRQAIYIGSECKNQTMVLFGKVLVTGSGRK